MIHDFGLVFGETKMMVGEVGSGDVHEFIETVFTVTNKNDIICEEDSRYIGGTKVNSKARGVEIYAKIINEEAKQQWRKIAA